MAKRVCNRAQHRAREISDKPFHLENSSTIQREEIGTIFESPKVKFAKDVLRARHDLSECSRNPALPSDGRSSTSNQHTYEYRICGIVKHLHGSFVRAQPRQSTEWNDTNNSTNFPFLLPALPWKRHQWSNTAKPGTIWQRRWRRRQGWDHRAETPWSTSLYSLQQKYRHLDSLDTEQIYAQLSSWIANLYGAKMWLSMWAHQTLTRLWLRIRLQLYLSCQAFPHIWGAVEPD